MTSIHRRTRAVVAAALTLGMLGMPAPPERLAKAETTEPDPLRVRGVVRAPVGQAVPAPDWSSVIASLHVFVVTSAGLGLVQDGSSLYSGDQMELHVRVGQPAWIYLLLVGSNGDLDRLYPVPGEPERLLPGPDQRIPADPAFVLRLDDHPGIEQLVFVASAHPLGPREQNVRALVNAAGSAGESPAQPRKGRAAAGSARPPAGQGEAADQPQDPHPGPSWAAERLRGIGRGRAKYGAAGRAIDLQPDASGVAVAVLHYRHLAHP